jgi:hypothetical protein
MQVDLQPRREQHLARWKQLEADPELAKLPFKIETDRFDRILISPPPFFRSHPLYRHDHGAIARRRSGRHQSRLWLTVDAAAQFGDLIVVAIPLKALDSLPARALPARSSSIR